MHMCMHMWTGVSAGERSRIFSEYFFLSCKSTVCRKLAYLSQLAYLDREKLIPARPASGDPARQSARPRRTAARGHRAPQTVRRGSVDTLCALWSSCAVCAVRPLVSDLRVRDLERPLKSATPPTDAVRLLLCCFSITSAAGTATGRSRSSSPPGYRARAPSARPPPFAGGPSPPRRCLFTGASVEEAAFTRPASPSVRISAGARPHRGHPLLVTVECEIVLLRAYVMEKDPSASPLVSVERKAVCGEPKPGCQWLVPPRSTMLIPPAPPLCPRTPSTPRTAARVTI